MSNTNTMATGLVRYDAMTRAIAEAHAVDEVKDIRDQAIALERYAQQAQNTEAERQACNIRLRAESRAGELLEVVERDERRGAGRPSEEIGVHAGPQLTPYQEAKRKARISDTQAKRWQKLAKVPKDEFEEALADPTRKPTTAGLIRKHSGSDEKIDPDALWIWGRLRDFERMDIGAREVSGIVGEMTETMLADLQRIVPVAASWLAELTEALDTQWVRGDEYHWKHADGHTISAAQVGGETRYTLWGPRAGEAPRQVLASDTDLDALRRLHEARGVTNHTAEERFPLKTTEMIDKWD